MKGNFGGAAQGAVANQCLSPQQHPTREPAGGEGKGPRTLLVPDLQRLAADAVQDRQEAGLERVLEHGGGGHRGHTGGGGSPLG